MNWVADCLVFLLPVIRLFKVFSIRLLSRFDEWSGNYRRVLLPIADSFDEDAEINFKQLILCPESTCVARYFDRYPYGSTDDFFKYFAKSAPIEDSHGNMYKIGKVGNIFAIKLISNDPTY